MSDELNIKKKRNNQIKTKSSTTSGRGEADIDYVGPIADLLACHLDGLFEAVFLD